MSAILGIFIDWLQYWAGRQQGGVKPPHSKALRASRQKPEFSVTEARATLIA